MLRLRRRTTGANEPKFESLLCILRDSYKFANSKVETSV